MNKPHMYKFTNKVNGKFYYGVHDGTKTDKYLGSGKLLKMAQKKYGLDNFSKEILLWFDSMDEAYEYEEVVVNQAMVDNPNCYNMKTGGRGGRTGEKRSELSKRRMSKAMKGKSKSQKHKSSLSKAMKGRKPSSATYAAQKEIVKCPHCSKEGARSAMGRWHFENCRTRKEFI